MRGISVSASAITPPKGPSPKATIRISAHTRAGMARKTSKLRRMRKCSASFETKVLAPSNPKGMAPRTPKKVPATAIAKVAAKACRIRTSSPAALGGNMPPMKSASFERPLAKAAGVISTPIHRATNTALNPIQSARRRMWTAKGVSTRCGAMARAARISWAVTWCELARAELVVMPSPPSRSNGGGSPQTQGQSE